MKRRHRDQIRVKIGDLMGDEFSVRWAYYNGLSGMLFVFYGRPAVALKVYGTRSTP